MCLEEFENLDLISLAPEGLWGWQMANKISKKHRNRVLLISY